MRLDFARLTYSVICFFSCAARATTPTVSANRCFFVRRWIREVSEGDGDLEQEQVSLEDAGDGDLGLVNLGAVAVTFLFILGMPGGRSVVVVVVLGRSKVFMMGEFGLVR